jgi:hypothetical protein
MAHRSMILRSLLWRLTVSALAAGFFVLIFSARRHHLGFDLRGTPPRESIATRPGMALPPGLQSGDQVIWSEQSRLMRAVLISDNVPASASYPLLIRRGASHQIVQVRSVPLPRGAKHAGSILLQPLAYLMILLLGLLTLWRGRDWSAWGLSLFAFSMVTAVTLAEVPLPPYWNLLESFFLPLVGGPLVFLGLYLTARSLTGADAEKYAWRDAAYVLLLIALWATEAWPMLMLDRVSEFSPPAGLELATLAMGFSAAILPLVVLIRGYLRATADVRLRIRWILTGTALLLPLLAVGVLLQAAWTQEPRTIAVLGLLQLALVIVIIGLFTYAILRQRLVDVRVVINRALVYALLMGLIVGCFALLESLIERSALGEGAGLTLEIGVPLVLGVLFHQLHVRLEALVDRLFFGHEHRARQALGEFVRDAGFVESPQVLIARTVETFARHSGGSTASLFELQQGSFVRRGAYPATAACPAQVDHDDPALVRLRATRAPLDLHGIPSAFGADGLLLPLSLRGRLYGVVLCGPRAAGRHAKADIDRLAQAVHEIGASLFALRAQANESELQAWRQGQSAHPDAAFSAPTPSSA